MSYYEERKPEPDKTTAFFKGGCGCLIGFVLMGITCAAVGGRFHMDLGGAVFLFIGGGIIGLIVLAIYNRGRNNAR